MGPDSPLASRILGGVFGVKHLRPGKYKGREEELSQGRPVLAAKQDSATICVDPGAAVVDPVTGDLLGVEFATTYLVANSFVPIWEMVKDAAFVQALEGRTNVGPAPAGVWVRRSSSKGLLLDAYVALREGDLGRVSALLDLVPTEPPGSWVEHRRALLRAASLISVDRAAAGSVLEELVEIPPNKDSGSREVDHLAIVATRLRLAVDADAERMFIEEVAKGPYDNMLEPMDFRVITPPRTLFAHGGAARILPGTPSPAWAAAERVRNAERSCRRLEPWEFTFASALVDPAHVLTLARAQDARSLLAGLVAMARHTARRVGESLLETVGIEPHPDDGWTPIIGPLWTLLRDYGRLPERVESLEGLAGWLQESHTSGRLGAYLSRLAPVELPLPWAAGLLHLLTPLPIHALLERLFVE
jgi:hypothetical protein